MVATSREGLAIAGEQVRPLRSLPIPGAAAGVEVIATTDSVALLTERARAARPDFVVDEKNAAAVAEICRRVDGIPLAIELAAAWVASMGPAQMADRLDERSRLLTGSRRRTVERHQTLRATLEWSYSLLDARERAVFDRVGVFARSFDAEAAEAVAVGGDIEEWDVLDALGELVAKSMLVAEPMDDGTVRYGLIETLRHYALDQLAEHGDVEAVRELHAAHYARLAEELGSSLIGPMEHEVQARIAGEVHNFRTAVGFGRAALADDPEVDDPAFSIAHALLAVQAATRGDVDECIGIMREALVLVGPVEKAPYAATSFQTIIAIHLGLFGGDLDLGSCTERIGPSVRSLQSRRRAVSRFVSSPMRSFRFRPKGAATDERHPGIHLARY